MMVHYTARKTPLTSEVKPYCEKRLKSMDKLMRGVIEVDLIFSAPRNRQMVEIHLKAKGGGLVVQEEGLELMRVLDQAFDNLEKKLKKDKEKLREKKRRRGREIMPEMTPPASAETGRRIIRSNDVSPKPMTADEAALQLDQTKKDILVFRTFGSERWAILYRRKDGHYGLVEPEG
jgi:putative sigma-54 modulation protein